MSRRRLMAVLALLAVPALLAVAITTIVRKFPVALLPLAFVILAVALAWFGLIHRGAVRVLGAAGAAIALALAGVILVIEGLALELVLSVAGFVLLGACTREALRIHVDLPEVAPPRHPVLFYNPKSGGGKAARFAIDREARARGIEPIELGPADDLEELVRDAVAAGADGLAMAGGDGSQAIVAAIASEFGLPYACVPAGTRNHFALDLGVDREDVVGALNAFVDGGERLVDLGCVNGRVFVNNVSLGLYAEAVKRPTYRDEKLRTLLDQVPEVIGPQGQPPDLRWSEADGQEHRSGAAIIVSNNQYLLRPAIGSGTRPRIDDGLLGITVVSRPEEHGFGSEPAGRPWRQWSAPTFEVDSESQVAAGIDGEAALLAPPLSFEIMPQALRVRIARAHPGASPSAAIPDTAWGVAQTLMRIAAGREPTVSNLDGPDRHTPQDKQGRHDGHL